MSSISFGFCIRRGRNGAHFQVSSADDVPKGTEPTPLFQTPILG